MKQNAKFSHESLQDRDSIKSLLKALSSGLGKGRVEFEDGDDVLTLKPEGLLHLKISASEDDEKSRLNIRITWDSGKSRPEHKPLKMNGKKI